MGFYQSWWREHRHRIHHDLQNVVIFISVTAA
jgi:hypothetical protein